MIYKLIPLIFLFGCSQIELKPITEDVKKIFTQNIVTENEITTAFKELLENATTKSIERLSSTDGFLNDPEVTISFPDQAQKVEQSLRKIGFNSLCDEFHVSINKAAEAAVSEAGPIFIEAIKNIKFHEASKLLQGSETAITDFLKSKTSTALATKFNPIISENLEKYDAIKKWSKLIKKYNKLPLVKPIQVDLSDYVTAKTIDGVFYYISKEETQIRKNPEDRVSDLIKKVFAQAD